MSDSQAHHRGRRGLRTDLALVCAVVSVAALVLAVFAWSRPTTKSIDTTYTQSASLGYSAHTAASSVYGSKGVVTGEPVYLSEVPALTLRYVYSVSAPVPVRLKGTEEFTIRVSGNGGLVRSVPLWGARPFAGNGFTRSGVLDLSTIRAVVASFQSVGNEQGGSGSYTVSIVPEIRIHGRLAGAGLVSRFSQPMKFMLGATALAPESAHPTGTGVTSPATATAGTGTGQPIVESAAGTVSSGRVRSALLLPGLAVADARILALALLAASLAGGVLFGLPLWRDARSTDERVRIATKFGASLVTVDALPESPSIAVVELCSFDGLVQVSRRLECPMLHLQSEIGDEFAVIDNGTVYRYRVAKIGLQSVWHQRTGLARAGRHVGNGHRPVDGPVSTS